MKNSFLVYLIFVLSLVCHLHAQENEATEEKKQKQDDIFEIGSFDVRIFYPQTLGAHFLNKAYSQDMGFEVFFNMYSLYNFKIGIGVTHFNSSLTDASLAGNFRRAIYRTYYLQVAYPLYQTNAFEAGAQVGLGYHIFRQRSSGLRGSYNTLEARAGVYATYQLTELYGLSFGVNYLTTNPDVTRSSESGGLFGRTQLVYPYLGVNIKL